ncbi:MAG TPA: hypothetical protein PLK06_02685 [bacterium]|nr:hypothetical protein [bacterium]
MPYIEVAPQPPEVEMLLLAMSLAQASDRSPNLEPEKLYMQAKQVCRHNTSSGWMADGQALRSRAKDLDQTLQDMIDRDLPALQSQVRDMYAPDMSETDREGTMQTLSRSIEQLRLVEHRLSLSIQTSEQVAELLTNPGTKVVRGRERHAAVNLCAGDRMQLLGVMAATVRELEGDIGLAIMQADLTLLISLNVRPAS